MKIIAFVGETFSDYQNKKYTKPTSIAFLQDAFGAENVYAASPSIKVTDTPENYSSVVHAGQFYDFPHYSSTKQFMTNCIFKKGYYKNYKNLADDVINKHKGEWFWIRTPSIGSIIFGLRALKANQKVLHHMCADASNTWKDSKYKGVQKFFAFIMSRFVRYLLKKICSNKNTTNFCTGDVLEDFSRKYSTNTHQFVDVMIKDIDSSDFQLNQNDNPIFDLLFLGRMVEDKGILDLIEVVNRLKEKVHLTLVGDGPDLNKAKSIVIQLGLQDSIKFTGQLPHGSLAKLFNQADLITVPSNNNYEGFPRVIMEGWAHNKPVIVSRVGGVMAFVKHNENGLIFEPGNREELHSQISALLTDRLLFDKLRDGAKSMAKISTQQYWLDFLTSVLKKETKK
jgi:glycosyltransferase involved in cell wall biosynthesis